MVQGAGCRVQGAGFGVQGSGFRVQGAGCMVQGVGFGVQGAGCRFQGSGFRLQYSGLRVQGSGCRVQGAGFRVFGCRLSSGCRLLPINPGSRLRWFNSSPSAGVRGPSPPRKPAEGPTRYTLTLHAKPQPPQLITQPDRQVFDQGPSPCFCACNAAFVVPTEPVA